MPTPERADLLPMLDNLTPEGFEAAALAVFRYQAAYNALYARWLQLLGRDAAAVGSLAEIPFLPIPFFKTHAVKAGDWTPETIFISSGTSGRQPSRHLVRALNFYLNHARRGFAASYGDPADWCILALLPSYLERGDSSLVAMAADFVARSKYPESGFFLHDFEKLRDTLRHCQAQKRPTLLLGVSFALLDFAAQGAFDLKGVTVMETGGMKGRRAELTRAELHETLGTAFGLAEIHSEYGMTELFSQAYSQNGGIFRPAVTLRAFVTDPTDPFCPAAPGRTGVLNFADLANLDTCSFIATEDLGRLHPDGRFEVLGRLDAAELRGCNLMIES